MDEKEFEVLLARVKVAAERTYNGSIIELVEKLAKVLDMLNSDLEKHIISMENIEDRLLATSCHCNDANETGNPVGSSAKPENVMSEKTPNKKPKNKGKRLKRQRREEKKKDFN